MKTIVYINFILTILLIGGFFWLLVYQKPKEIVTQTTQIKEIVYSTPIFTTTPVPVETKETIKTVFVTPVPSTTRSQTTYIPIIGPISTTSLGWYDAPGTEFYLNTADYGKNMYASWEASLKIAHGNGSAYARLFDVTHGIAVNGSELVVSNKSDLTESYSGGLNFWAGNNLYRVQIKSLNSYEATFGNGRLKIMY